MDIRTYDADSDVDAEQMTHFDARAELNAYAAENARLTHELDLRIRQLMQLSKDYAALLGTHEQTRAELAGAQDNAAELGKALDMCIAERDGAFAEVDAHGRELSALRDERPRLLAANKRLADERDAAHRESDTQTIKANSFRSELHRYIAHANELKEMLDTSVAERDALRAELVDAET